MPVVNAGFSVDAIFAKLMKLPGDDLFNEVSDVHTPLYDGYFQIVYQL
jgi:hypothetical protein